MSHPSALAKAASVRALVWPHPHLMASCRRLAIDLDLVQNPYPCRAASDTMQSEHELFCVALNVRFVKHL